MVYEFNIRERTLEDSIMFLEFINQLDTEAEYMLFEEGERKATLESIRKNTLKTIEDGDICYIVIYNNKIVGFIIAVKDKFIRTKHIATLVLGVLEEKSDNFEMQNIHNYVDEISDLPLLGVYVSKDSPAIGKNIAELELPDEIRIVAIRQTEDYISPKGNTIIREGDRMLITSISEDSVKSVCDKFKFETS